MKHLAAIVVCVALAGCATNSGIFTERLYNEETGALVQDTRYRQVGLTTYGSRQETATGDMRYAWGGDSEIAITNGATGQHAGDAAATIQALVGLGQLLAPYLNTLGQAQLTEAQQPPWAVQILRELQVLRSQQTASQTTADHSSLPQ